MRGGLDSRCFSASVLAGTCKNTSNLDRNQNRRLTVSSHRQHPNFAVQIVLAKQDVPTGTALLSLFQTLGGAVFAAVGQNVFIAKFTHGLDSIPGINSNAIVHIGATGLKNAVSPQLQQKVLEAYNISLTQGPFLAALIVACLALPAALGMEWRSVKVDQQSISQPAAPDEEKPVSHGDTRTMMAFAEPETNSTDASEKDESEASGRVLAWKRMYHSSGCFSHWVTAKVNPDLSVELERTRKLVG